MVWRPAAVEDLGALLAIDRGSLGDEIVGRSRALAAYTELVLSGRFLSAVVRQPPSGRTASIVGFGGALFVSDRFFQEEIAHPRPGLNARIVASVAEGTGAVLGENEIRRDNTHGGLTVLVMHAGWSPDTLSGDQLGYLEGALSYAFFQLMRGYRLRRLVREAASTKAIEHVKSQRVFATMISFDQHRAPHANSRWNHDRALFVAERDACLALPASVAAMLFSYSEPMLRLRDADQQLLMAALDGLTDQELSQRLNLKMPTLKKRWASLFERVRNSRPDLIPHPADVAPDNRGPQKRHRLLAYLREHPSELRPFLSGAMRRQRDTAVRLKV